MLWIKIASIATIITASTVITVFSIHLRILVCMLNMHMPTRTLAPYTVTQTTTGSEVAWQLTSTPWTVNDHNRCGLTAPLRAVHNLADLSGTGNSGTLNWSGYANISAVTADGSTVSPVTAIQIKVFADKRGRLRDKTIKLTVNGSAVRAIWPAAQRATRTPTLRLCLLISQSVVFQLWVLTHSINRAHSHTKT